MIISCEERCSRQREADAIRVTADRLARSWEAESERPGIRLNDEAISRLLIWAESALTRLAKQASAQPNDLTADDLAIQVSARDLNEVLGWVLGSIVREQGRRFVKPTSRAVA